MDRRIEVLLVDDHMIARSGVRLMLGTCGDLAVAAEATDAAAALGLLRERAFDVALVDIQLPGRNGLDLLKTMRAEWPRMAVLMLSTYAEDIYAVRALRLGAAGYLTKDVPTAELAGAVRKAAAGGRHVGAALVDKLAALVAGGGLGGHEALSNREFEVFRLIAAGESLVHIGARLHLSPNTVTTYRARILEKMHLEGNADITRYALEHGII